VVFPVIIGALIWGGLFLRNERLRALLLQRSFQHQVEGIGTR
jgi:hypothetical protein